MSKSLNDVVHIVKTHYKQDALDMSKNNLSQQGKFIGEFEIKANDQSHMSLGFFREDEHIKGFSIYISPDPQEDTVASQVTKTQSENNEEFELVLYIANCGDIDISAEILSM